MTTVGQSVYPAQNNTYVPNHEATAYLVTQFSRNIKDFPLNRYVQIKDISKMVGLYLRLNAEQAGRLKDGKLDQFKWPDGASRPRRNNGTEKFNWVQIEAERFNYDFTLGWLSRDQAGFDLQDVEFANLAQLAMTARTRRVHEVLENDALWDASHIANVTSDIASTTGPWDVSTTNRSDIKKSINYAVDIIRKDTLAKVKNKKDMVLVMNPLTAQRISESQEMVNAFIQSPEAFGHFTGDESKYDNYGLPSHLYGVEVVVEDSVMVTSARNASTQTKTDVCEDGTVYLMSRPGGLESKAGNGPNYSTMMLMIMEDMTVESLDSTEDRRTEGHVVDNTAEELTAPVSGFKFTDVIT